MFALNLTNDSVPEKLLPGTQECQSCHTVDMCWGYDQGPHCYACAAKEVVGPGN